MASGRHLVDHPKIISRVFRLQIDQPHLVPGIANGGRDEFKAQGFEPEVNLGIHEAARMNSEDLHKAGSVG
ncbi:MAG: hypothetical protein H0W20_06925 [Chthoniobacterales bacterium]|jgi:hypothetical protein|nr:hypothetical protein [Chthoniobacterales bacterium]